MHIISSYILCYVILYCSAQCWHGRLREPGLPISHMKYTTPATTQHNAARYNTPDAMHFNTRRDATQYSTTQCTLHHTAGRRRFPAADEIRGEHFPPAPPRDSDGVTARSLGANASSPSHRPSRPSHRPSRPSHAPEPPVGLDLRPPRAERAAAAFKLAGELRGSQFDPEPDGA